MTEQLLAALIGAAATLAAGVISVLVNARLKDKRERERRAKGSGYGIKISSPRAPVKLHGRVEVSGGFDQEPPDGSLWVLVTTPDRSRFWPQMARVEISKVRKTWHGAAWIEGDARILAITAGAEAQKLFRYFGKVGQTLGKWQSIDEMPSDIVEHDEVVVQHHKDLAAT